MTHSFTLPAIPRGRYRVIFAHPHDTAPLYMDLTGDEARTVLRLLVALVDDQRATHDPRWSTRRRLARGKGGAK